MPNRLQTIKDPTLQILIVDDSVQYTQVLKRILEKAFGYMNVSSVSSPSLAYEIIHDTPEKYSLLFVDYNFPGEQSGGQFLKQLQKTGLLENKVAFLITSEPTADNLKEAQSAGASGVVAKPFDRLDLQKQLEKADRALQVDLGESF